jgi:hypothetical protein
MAGRAQGLTEAARLELEHHLETCPACAADERDLRRLIVGSGATERPALSERARERAITRALSEAATRVDITPAPRPWLRWALPSLAVAGAAVAVAVVLLTGGDQPAQRSAGVATDAHHVLDGDIATASGVVAPGMEFAADAEITTRAGASVAVGHATVRLEANTTVSWNPTASTLTLRNGAIRASVAPGPKLPFLVDAGAFTVEVRGTEFDVTRDGVTVDEGLVRITDADGEVLLDSLAAGEAWHVPEEIAARPRKVRKRRPRQQPRDAAELIDRARTHLAARDVEDARAALEQALAVTKTTAEKAEARTLLAECALVDGDHREAARLYRRAADRYQKMRQGETALFAAARIEARNGGATQARALLELYLERYPDGRFIAEAERRLDELD